MRTTITVDGTVVVKEGVVQDVFVIVILRRRAAACEGWRSSRAAILRRSQAVAPQDDGYSTGGRFSPKCPSRSTNAFSRSLR